MSLGSNKTAYLAGPITGCNYDGCTSWREYVAKALDGKVECLSPMRGKFYLEGVDSIAHEYPDRVLSTQRAIMHRDRWDAKRCDIVICNLLGADRVSIGTVMELAWAYDHGKPVVVAIEDKNNIHEHGMLRETFSFRVQTVDELIHTAKIVLNVDVPLTHKEKKGT